MSVAGLPRGPLRATRQLHRPPAGYGAPARIEVETRARVAEIAEQALEALRRLAGAPPKPRA